MDLTRHLLADLTDVTTLYERKLCSLGVVRLKLERASGALRLDEPGWSEALAALAEEVAAAEADKLPYLDGMALMDRVRAFVNHPPAREVAPAAPRVRALELVPPADELPEDDSPVEAAPDEPLPSDPSEPATPRGLPRRNL